MVERSRSAACNAPFDEAGWETRLVRSAGRDQGSCRRSGGGVWVKARELRPGEQPEACRAQEREGVD